MGYVNGIKFTIHTKEKGHNVRHVHASYQGKEISIDINNAKIIQGNLPKKEMKIALDWVKKNKNFLNNKWDLLVSNNAL